MRQREVLERRRARREAELDGQAEAFSQWLAQRLGRSVTRQELLVIATAANGIVEAVKRLAAKSPDGNGGALDILDLLSEAAAERVASSSSSVPPLKNGFPRVKMIDGRIFVLVTEDVPVDVMAVDSGLVLEHDASPALGGISQLAISARRVRSAPTLRLVPDDPAGEPVPESGGGA